MPSDANGVLDHVRVRPSSCLPLTRRAIQADSPRFLCRLAENWAVIYRSRAAAAAAEDQLFPASSSERTKERTRNETAVRMLTYSYNGCTPIIHSSGGYRPIELTV